MVVVQGLQYFEDVGGWIKLPPLGASPALQASRPDAWAELLREVELAQCLDLRLRQHHYRLLRLNLGSCSSVNISGSGSSSLLSGN